MVIIATKVTLTWMIFFFGGVFLKAEGDIKVQSMSLLVGSILSALVVLL